MMESQLYESAFLKAAKKKITSEKSPPPQKEARAVVRELIS